MAYAALQDMIDRFGLDEMTLLTDRTGTGSPDPNTAAMVLNDASSQINTYLASRYQLPLTPVPDVAVRWACDLARFQLYRTEAPANVSQNYKTALTELVAAQKGLLTLEASAVDVASNGSAAEFSGPDRTFDKTSLRGF